ncbi:hypothetical protein BKH46_05420 [Helicobacter sp. 12S02634-8]|uniref:DUF6290 family protein n=1 Tax=Helicobacter sp. 12S02634-8 TaxID=1476199 RepID=UPI000BA72478|nr:DUF6290 family protein [Helicobacter sp. 12S02634-8]PAF47146.1 hypothetical protein BKH46_05420 [Helicobacter sp. 12S02634-8]
MDITLNLPKEAHNILYNIAKEQNISQEELAKQALLEYLEDIEDYKKGELAYQEYVEGGRKGIAWNDLKKELNL